MKAIVIVDMLNDFRDGILANPRMEYIIPNVLALIDRLLKSGEYKIYFLCDSHAADDVEFRLFPPHCLKGTYGAEVIPEMQRYINGDKSNLIFKTKYSGFFGTGMDEIIRRDGIREVILIGVLTEICVFMNAAEFFYRGIEVRLAADCVETFDAPGHDAEKINRYMLGYMKNNFGVRIAEKHIDL